MRYFLIVLALFGCKQMEALDHRKVSTGNPNGTNVIENATLAVYMRNFDAFYGVNSTTISSEFATLESPTVGLCWTYSDGSHLIQIDTTYWDSVNEMGKEQVILHEYGHCQFGLDHNSKMLDLGEYGMIPETVMNPYVFGDAQYYVDFHDYYLKELKP